MSAAPWEGHLAELLAQAELCAAGQQPEVDDAVLTRLGESALDADGDGREAMVRAGALEVLLKCSEDAAEGGKWTCASTAATCARTVAADPKACTVLDPADDLEAFAFEFSFNNTESVSRFFKVIHPLLRLARVAGPESGGEHADNVRFQALRMIAGCTSKIGPELKALVMAEGEKFISLLEEVIAGGGRGWGGAPAQLTAIRPLLALSNRALFEWGVPPSWRSRLVETLVRTGPTLGLVGYLHCLVAVSNLADKKDCARAVLAAGAIQLAADAFMHARASSPLPFLGRPGVTLTLQGRSCWLLYNLCCHEALHAELRAADVPALLLPMTAHPDNDTAFTALLGLVSLLGGSDDKDNPHIKAAAAGVPHFCEVLRLTLAGERDAGGVLWNVLNLLKPAAKMAINDENMVGELNFSMYGTREAAQNWGEECASTMAKIGFDRGTAPPCTISHPQGRLRRYIQGGDFATAGLDHDLK